MLVEALLYLLTPAPFWARRNGFLRESIAIGARHDRQKAAWAPHLDNSRQTILSAVECCEGTAHALVLGSGHGFDLPLHALSARFDRVTLVDAVHPLSMRWRVRRLSNVALETADVTGRHGPELPIDDEPDLIVSLNLISQLGVAPGDPVTGREDDRAAHLAWLRARTGTVCVIGDVERVVSTESGAVEKTELLDWPGVPQTAGDKEWIWRLAPLGEISKNVEMVSRVRGVIWRGK